MVVQTTAGVLSNKKVTVLHAFSFMHSPITRYLIYIGGSNKHKPITKYLSKSCSY